MGRNEHTFLFRFAIWSLITGKYAFIFPSGSMIVVRYGASCDGTRSARASPSSKMSTYKFPLDHVVQLCDRLLVRVAGHCAVGRAVRGGVEVVDVVGDAGLRSGHRCTRSQLHYLSRCDIPIRTSHSIEVGLALFL